MWSGDSQADGTQGVERDRGQQHDGMKPYIHGSEPEGITTYILQNKLFISNNTKYMLQIHVQYQQ